MRNLLDLVDDVYLHILLYLLPQDQLTFFSCNKFLKTTVGKKYRKVNIKQNQIHDFITNTSFQERLFQLMDDPSKQLSIVILHPRLKVPTPKKWQKLHPLLPKIFKLHTSFVDFQSYYSYYFETIEQISINEDRRDAKEIPVLNCFEKYQSQVIDLFRPQAKVIGFFPTTLKVLKIFRSSHTHFDVSTLWWNTLHQIELNYCENLLSLPDCFNCIPIVKIWNCNKLQHVHMLQDNRDVELLSNFLLTDFTDCFQNCHALKLAASNIKFNLYNLEKIEEFSVSVRSIDSLIIVPGQPLPSSLRKLGLNGLRNLTDLTPLQHLEELELNSIDTIVSVEPLGTIPVLKLSGLDGLKSLNGLGRGNKDVYIRDCGKISSFLPLQSVEKFICIIVL